MGKVNRWANEMMNQYGLKEKMIYYFWLGVKKYEVSKWMSEVQAVINSLVGETF